MNTATQALLLTPGAGAGLARGKALLRRCALVFAAATLVAGTALAQTYPSKPVNLMVPYPAGGVSDTIARIVEKPLGKALGQLVIIENLGGVSGALGAQKVLGAPADGYQLFQGSPNELILAPLAISAVKYKSDSFRLVQMISVGQLAVYTRPDLPAKTMDELIDYARKEAAAGRPLTYASVGPGSFYHLMGAQLSKVTGIPMTHVPYKGGAPANQDLIGGRVDIFITVWAKTYQQLAETGKIKVLALLNSERRKGLEQYPAITETKALKDFTFNLWTGYFVEKDTPEPVVETLHKALNQALAEPSVHDGIVTLGSQPAKPLSLQEAARFYVDETVRFRAIAKGIQLEPQ